LFARVIFGVGGRARGAPHGPPWRLLIVDDEPSVHDVTQLALGDFSFQGRGLAVQSALSAAAARPLLANGHRFAAILLDMVMENEHAGVDLVDFIRHELCDDEVRIILRTGQPGQAPERDVVTRLDINDYKAKAELTDARLFTSLATALRTYQHIVEINRQRRGLAEVLRAMTALCERRLLDDFATTALAHLSDILGTTLDGVICLTRVDDVAAGPVVLAGCGRHRPLRNTGVGLVTDAALAAAIVRANGVMTDEVDGARAVLPVTTGQGHRLIAGLVFAEALPDDSGRLLRLFLNTVGAGIDSIILYDAVQRANATLEQRVADRTAALETANRELERLATTDPLTGASNRRHFRVIAAQEVERAQRHGLPLSVLALDIDHFKRINDRHGHAAGDAALCRFADAVRTLVRISDHFARMGGEEFALLLPQTDGDGACALAERIRAAVAAAGAGLAMTVSIGVATVPAGERSVEPALARADEALYRAKATGRDRVVLA
jgi:diguanylate cyclase (GGDEF)-like protein